MLNNYIDILKAGKAEWNNWRKTYPQDRANFSQLNLDNSNFEGFNLSNCSFYKCSLKNCNFNKTEICWSAFFHCKLNNSIITDPDILDYSDHSSVWGVNLRWSSFAVSDLENVNMKGCLFEGVHLHECNLKGANISYARIHGLSAWGNTVDSSTIQNNLVITPYSEPTIEVDNFEIAQFLYLIITNKNLRNVIDTLATKVILILGSFSKKDKILLDQMRKHLVHFNYIPVLFDFDKPNSRNLTETVSTIAHLAKFIIADLTNSRSIPHELASIVPTLSSVPIIPIIEVSQKPYGMFQDFKNYRNVAEIISYTSTQTIHSLLEEINKSANKIILELAS